MCMSCNGTKVKMASKSSPRQMPAKLGTRRVVGANKYGTPKVRMSFGSHKR